MVAMTKVVGPVVAVAHVPVPVVANIPVSVAAVVVNSNRVSPKKKSVQKPVISQIKKPSGVKPADFFPNIQKSKLLQSSHGRNLAKKSIRINKI